MKKLIFLAVYIFFLASCQEDSKKKEDPTLLKPSTCKIKIIIDSLIRKDSSTCFKLIPESSDYQIFDAYFDCGRKSTRIYDTINNRIKECDKNLLLEDDTVKIYFEPTIIGKNKFEDLTILLIHKEKGLSYVDTTFYYNVRN